MPTDYIKKAEDSFEKLLEHLGIRFDDKYPKDKLEFPSDPTALTDEELLSQISYWTRFSGYVLVKASILKSASRLAEARASNYYSSKFIGASKGKRVTDIKHIITADPSMKLCKSESIELTNKYDMLSVLGHTYEKYASVLSRELTRRTSIK
jgi:hypothetical protein